MSLQPGATLGRYQILEQLGRGGMATVYKAFQPAVGRVVALKVLRPGLASEGFARRFAEEARLVATLRHPNIVQVFDYDVVDGRHFLVMEHLEGGTLKSRLAQLGAGERLPRRDVLRIVREVAAALTHAHGAGVVHGDVKPANVLLARDGSAILSDFGIATLLAESRFPQVGVGAGTPEYMAPELVEGKAPDERSDVYALGVLAYGLLTGRLPFAADTPLAIALAHGADPLPLPTTVAPDLGKAHERVLLRALARDAAQRHARASDLAGALQEAEQLEAARGFRIAPYLAEAEGPHVRATPIAILRSRLALPRPHAYALGAILGGVFLAGVATGVVAARLAASEEAPSTPARPTPLIVTAPPRLPPPPVAAPPVASPLPPAPPQAGPPRGALLYEAKLDGSADLARVRAFAGGPADSAVRYARGAIELSVKPGAGIIADIPIRPRATYVAEFAVAMSPDSDALLSWGLRRAERKAYLLRIDARSETLYLAYCDDATETLERITPAVPVPGVRSGRRLNVGVSVVEDRFAIFLDGREVARASDGRLTGAGVLDVFLEGRGAGEARLLAARVFELP